MAYFIPAKAKNTISQLTNIRERARSYFQDEATPALSSMSQHWHGTEGRNYLEGLQKNLSSLSSAIDGSIYQAQVTINEKGINWAEDNQESFDASVPSEKDTLPFSLMAEDPTKYGMDREEVQKYGKSIIDSLEKVKQEIAKTSEAVADPGFEGGSMAQALSQSMSTISSKINSVLSQLNEETQTDTTTAINKNESTEQSTESSFTISD